MRKLVWMGLAAGVVVVAVAFVTRGRGFTARMSPWPFEAPVMIGARRWATPSAVRRQIDPELPSEAVVREGRDHWADHCATCHGNDGSGDTPIGRNLYPPAPDMRTQRTQEMTDGELFYVIERGIPFTGMPAWGTGTADGAQASWKLVRFIRHLPEVTADEVQQMEALNPKSAADIQQKEHIDDFLAGGR